MTYFKQIEIVNALNDLAGVTSYGELRMVEPIRLAGSSFTGTTVDSNFWTPTVIGSGSVTQLNGQQILSTGITANSSAQSITVALARFVTASQMRYLSRAQMGDGGTVNNARRWGPFNGTDGAYFKLAGTTLYACTMIGGVETAVPSASWNVSSQVPTLTNANFYEIYYSPETVIYAINGSGVHVALFPTSPWTSVYHLPVFMDNVNSGGVASNLLLTLRECAISRLGRFETQPKYGHITTAATAVLKYGPGLLHRIVLSNPGGSTLTLYDNTAGSGTAITSIKTPSQANPISLEFGVPFTIGLTVVSTGTWDAQVVYE